MKQIITALLLLVSLTVSSQTTTQDTTNIQKKTIVKVNSPLIEGSPYII